MKKYAQGQNPFAVANFYITFLGLQKILRTLPPKCGQHQDKAILSYMSVIALSFSFVLYLVSKKRAIDFKQIAQ